VSCGAGVVGIATFNVILRQSGMVRFDVELVEEAARGMMRCRWWKWLGKRLAARLKIAAF
jgi:uncharacterized protein YodC (DUF2158 family)